MDAKKIKHVYFFAYFRRRTLDAESKQFVRKSTQHYATERHAYSIVRYPTPDLRIYTYATLRMEYSSVVLRRLAHKLRAFCVQCSTPNVRKKNKHVLRNTTLLYAMRRFAYVYIYYLALGSVLLRRHGVQYVALRRLAHKQHTFCVQCFTPKVREKINMFNFLCVHLTYPFASICVLLHRLA